MRITSEVWGHLESESLFGDALSARLAAPDLSNRVLAALDREGRRHLLIALREDEAALADRRSRGLNISTRELQVLDGPPARYLDVACLDPAGFNVLDELGAELAAALSVEVETPDMAVRRLLAKWRRFWMFSSSATLTREQQIGLFAELWFLVYWLTPQLGLGAAVESWRGPLGARHDIELPAISIEVKASTSASGRIHHIHGIDQLAPPESGNLLLFSLAMRQEGGGANSLPKVVNHIRTLATTDDQSMLMFETRLERSGYADSAASEYESLRFRVVEERLYAVEKTFPRILVSSLVRGLPLGVGDINYTIDLAAFDACLVATTPEGLLIPTIQS